jgi:hypothetical protein
MPPRDDPAHGAPRPPRGINRLAARATLRALRTAKPRSRPLRPARARQVIAIYFSIGCLFIPIGAKCLITSQSVRAVPSALKRPGQARGCSTVRNSILTALCLAAQVVEVSQQYDGDCKPKFQTGALCSISLTVPRTMSPPVYVYYELNNAYFNHRRMVLSRSDAQLRGDEDIADSLLKTCAPQQFQGGNGTTLCVVIAAAAHACVAVRLCHRS